MDEGENVGRDEAKAHIRKSISMVNRSSKGHMVIWLVRRREEEMVVACGMVVGTS